MTTLTYLESIGDTGNSLQKMGFSHTAGAVSGTYQLDVDPDSDTTAVLQDAVNDIQGYTNTAHGSTQKLQRSLPATHPAFPYLYATQIAGMQGIGVNGDGLGGRKARRDAEVLPPITGNPQAITDTFFLYPYYQFAVTFSTLPYTVLPDDQVNVSSGSWYADGATSTTSFEYATEWMRYTDYSLTPQNNNISGSVGAFTFKALASTPIFTNPPFMYLPDAILSFTWYQVPYRFITSSNSYIANKGWLGRINQNDWYNWPAGSLLYLNYEVNKYTQPSLETQAVSDLDGDSWNSYAKTCDIKFTFLYTNRKAGTTPAAPFYGNWIAKGHNLQPYLPTRTFEYATAFLNAGTVNAFGHTSTGPADEQCWAPMWNSFPLEILFSDPDVGGGL
jgi:hypothetical protein